MNAMIETGGHAFPLNCGSYQYSGMTLRDYFAAKAMQAMLYKEGEPPNEDVAAWSYQVADAMIAAREVKP